MITIRVLSIKDYDGIYNMWLNTPGMGLNTTDDSREGIEKYIKRNPTSSSRARAVRKVGDFAKKKPLSDCLQLQTKSRL